VRLFRDSEEVPVQPALLHAALQGAARCAFGKAVSAFHMRLLANNDLLTLEEAFQQHGAGVFERGGRAQPFERTVERLRAVLAVLDDQELLLSRGGNDWMRAPALQLGPAHDEMLQRVAATSLLGPEAAAQWRQQSGIAFAQFRRHFDQLFGGRRAPGVVWLDDAGRFGLSPERAALRDGLYALLQESWMSDDAAGGGTVAGAWDLTGAVIEAQSLLDARQRFTQDTLPRFPPAVRPAIQRIVDARLGELAYEHAFRALKAAGPATTDLLPDSYTATLLREQVMQVRGLLARLGSPALGARLEEQISPEAAPALREQLSD
jgi:type VI secretion system protein ImpL